VLFRSHNSQCLVQKKKFLNYIRDFWKVEPLNCLLASLRRHQDRRVHRRFPPAKLIISTILPLGIIYSLPPHSNCMLPCLPLLLWVNLLETLTAGNDSKRRKEDESKNEEPKRKYSKVDVTGKGFADDKKYLKEIATDIFKSILQLTEGNQSRKRSGAKRVEVTYICTSPMMLKLVI